MIYFNIFYELFDKKLSFWYNVNIIKFKGDFFMNNIELEKFEEILKSNEELRNELIQQSKKKYLIKRISFRF